MSIAVNGYEITRNGKIFGPSDFVFKYPGKDNIFVVTLS
jgi:hypothetical protein